MKCSVLLLFSLFFMGGLSAQYVEVVNYNKKFEGMSVGLGVGANQFYCDVSERSFFEKWSNETKLSGHLYIGKEFNSWFALRAHLYSGSLISYRDYFEDGRAANLFIDTKFFELAAEGKFTLNPLWHDFENGPSLVDVYGIAGIGFASWNALLRDAITLEEIDYVADQTNVGLVTNVGLGVSYNFYKNWSVFTEGSVRPVFSEKVDMVTGGIKMDIPVIISFGVSYKFSDIVKRKKHKDKTAVIEDEEEEEIVKVNREQKAMPRLKILEFPEQRSAKELHDLNKGTKIVKEIPKVIPVKKETVEHKSIVEKDVDRVYFSIQILAVSKKSNTEYLKDKYHIIYPVKEHYVNGIYKYTVGDFASYNEALNYSNNIRSNGLYDAFIIVYRNNKQIKLTSALKRR